MSQETRDKQIEFIVYLTRTEAQEGMRCLLQELDDAKLEYVFKGYFKKAEEKIQEWLDSED